VILWYSEIDRDSDKTLIYAGRPHNALCRLSNVAHQYKTVYLRRQWMEDSQGDDLIVWVEKSPFPCRLPEHWRTRWSLPQSEAESRCRNCKDSTHRTMIWDSELMTSECQCPCCTCHNNNITRHVTTMMIATSWPQWTNASQPFLGQRSQKVGQRLCDTL